MPSIKREMNTRVKTDSSSDQPNWSIDWIHISSLLRNGNAPTTNFGEKTWHRAQGAVTCHRNVDVAV